MLYEPMIGSHHNRYLLHYMYSFAYICGMDMPVNAIVSGASCLVGLMVICCTTHDRLRVYVGLDATRQAGQVIIAN